MTQAEYHQHPYRTRFTDLVSERVGGKALVCSDQWFAECANLVKHDEPVFRQGHFVATGQWMDGWESRRSFGRAARREGGTDHDWCIVRLGVPGILYGTDIDTTHFSGNAPEHASLEGAWAPEGITGSTEWVSLLVTSPLQADSHNMFDIDSGSRVTHLRLNIFPDGGVARLRAWGIPRLLPADFVAGELVDLASVLHGGLSMQCSDKFYSSPDNLLLPQSGTNMGDGWETRRRRDNGNDWCIIRLGVAGSIRKVVVDTAHFNGNYPDHFSLEATHTERIDLDAENIEWQLIIAATPLHPDQLHHFVSEVLSSSNEKFTHVRLNIYPDGGVSRLRVMGEPDWDSVA